MSLNKEEKEEIANQVSVSIAMAIQKELGSYKVDKEQHYQDHIWLKDFREWSATLKSSIWKTIIDAFIKVLLFLLLAGIIFWGKKQIKGE